MQITREEIIKLSDNLLFNLADVEVDILLKDFKEISESMEMISNIKGIEKVPVMHGIPYTEPVFLRSDEAANLITKAEVIENSADSIDGEIRIPKVVKDEEY